MEDSLCEGIATLCLFEIITLMLTTSIRVFHYRFLIRDKARLWKGCCKRGFFCHVDPPPAAWQKCNVNPCPSEYKWHVGDWQDCSRTCGGGTKRRTKMCAGKDMIPTSWKLCKDKAPVTAQK